MAEVEFKMPRMGESITQATIIKWFKGVGDTVEYDEILLEVATDKVDSEVPSTISGEIVELLYEPNDVVEIGETIAVIKSDGKTKSTPVKTETLQFEAKPKPASRPSKMIATRWLVSLTQLWNLANSICRAS